MSLARKMQAMSIPLQYCPGCGTKHCVVSTNDPDFTLDTLLCDNCKQPHKPAAEPRTFQNLSEALAYFQLEYEAGRYKPVDDPFLDFLVSEWKADGTSEYLFPGKPAAAPTLREEVEQINTLFGPKCKTCSADLPDGGVTGYCADHKPDRIAELRRDHPIIDPKAPMGFTLDLLGETLRNKNADINELLNMLEKPSEDGQRWKRHWLACCDTIKDLKAALEANQKRVEAISSQYFEAERSILSLKRALKAKLDQQGSPIPLEALQGEYHQMRIFENWLRCKILDAKDEIKRREPITPTEDK